MIYSMEPITSVKELYLEFISDIYHGEVLLAPELRFFIEQSKSVELQKMIKKHLYNTRSHTDQLEELQENILTNILREHCRTMKSMILESKELVDRCTDPNIRERAIVGSLHRITNCLSTAYQMLIAMADELDLPHHNKILQRHLEEEHALKYQTLSREFNLQKKL